MLIAEARLVSVVAVELFTTSAAEKCEKIFLEEWGDEIELSPLAPVYCHVGKKRDRIHRVVRDAEQLDIVIGDTGFTLAKTINLGEFDFSVSDLHRVLKARKDLNSKLIEQKVDGLLCEVLTTLNDNRQRGLGEVWPSYAFSFFVLSGAGALNKNQRDVLKVLAEPSLINFDDNSDGTVEDALASVEPSALQRISDVDISVASEVYVTWSTISSYTNEKLSVRNDTLELLTCLELRLQSLWNSCYSVSALAEDVFDGRRWKRNIEDIYIGFARSLDDARSVLTSTLSGRAAGIFEEMVRTSKVEAEIRKLENKLLLLEKYVQRARRNRSELYNRFTELFLFIVAATTILDALIGFPLVEFTDFWKNIVVLGGFSGILILAIVLFFTRPKE